MSDRVLKQEVELAILEYEQQMRDERAAEFWREQREYFSLRNRARRFFRQVLRWTPPLWLRIPVEILALGLIFLAISILMMGVQWR